MNFVVVLLYVVIILLCLYVIALFAKNHVTYKNVGIISSAIHRYNLSILADDYYYPNFEDKLIDYDCMKEYDEVLYNWFDWGYENIVPRNVLERIKPYILK